MTAAARADAVAGQAPRRRPMFRGLILGLILSVVNLVGGFLAISSLPGGLGDWSKVQFVGLFGLLEVATGMAFIIGPNIWRLPVAEANTSDRTKIRLAASTIFIPHWAAATKLAAGVAMLGVAVVGEGVGEATLGVPIFVLAVVAGVIGCSLLFARLGVARPDLDVFSLRVLRPGGKEHAFPGASIGALVVQLLLNFGILPAVKLLSPSVLYQPEVGPSWGALAVTLAIGVVLVLASLGAWRGRISWRAPREQQREAERNA